MGVRRLFSRRGQNFPGGGQKNTICLKSTQKDTIFLEKSRKTYYFGRPRGDKGTVLPSPADAHGHIRICNSAQQKSKNKMIQIEASIPRHYWYLLKNTFKMDCLHDVLLRIFIVLAYFQVCCQVEKIEKQQCLIKELSRISYHVFVK